MTMTGILEDGTVTVSDRGTGQGSVISPLFANIYLHYVLDLWANRWRRREATGDMIIVRYADDVVAGFEHEDDARRFLDAMRTRFEEFALSLHVNRHAKGTPDRHPKGTPFVVDCMKPRCFFVWLGGVSLPRPDHSKGGARSRGQAWPQAIGGADAQRA
jgi:hypothetical protein